jgi:acetylornithine deacetylase/succinyl-diaminopimelate desuccinylase-like protein
MNEAMLEELYELLRIPSISSGGGDPADLTRAAEWIRDKIRDAGGSADLVETAGFPLTVGSLEASRAGAPTVLVYGHYDVQSPDPIDEWESDPFEPTIRGDRLYARGASDDKGNFFPLLWVACDLAKQGKLPLNLRFVAEGEEEIGSPNIAGWLSSGDIEADAAIVFDSMMVNERLPAVTLGVRGIISFDIQVTVGDRNLHSGMYGGQALNALHVLHGILARMLPDPDGKLPQVLQKGVIAPDPKEVASWSQLPPGEEVVRHVGGRPISQAAVDEYYVRNWTQPALDMHGVMGGDALQVRTIIPAQARAKASIRLVPDQTTEEMTAILEGLVKAATPEGAEVTFKTTGTGEPAVFDPNTAALQAGIAAIGEATGIEPALIRVGGSISILGALAERGIPTIMSGFALADDAVHAPNESFRLESLEHCERSAYALYERLSKLND